MSLKNMLFAAAVSVVFLMAFQEQTPTGSFPSFHRFLAPPLKAAQTSGETPEKQLELLVSFDLSALQDLLQKENGGESLCGLINFLQNTPGIRCMIVTRYGDCDKEINLLKRLYGVDFAGLGLSAGYGESKAAVIGEYLRKCSIDPRTVRVIHIDDTYGEFSSMHGTAGVDVTEFFIADPVHGSDSNAADFTAYPAQFFSLFLRALLSADPARALVYSV